jgi:hypothetical protein
MRTLNIAGTVTAILLAAAIAAAGQSAQPASKTKSTQSANSVTLVGCLISETDYRQAHGMGKGALSGAGMGDEFVLVDTTVVPGSAVGAVNDSTTSSTPPAASAGAAATCTEHRTGPAYRVTGHREEELKGLAGRRMEITGTIKHEDVAAAKAQAGAKLPPEIDMSAYHEAPVASAAQPAPAPPAPAAVEPRPEPAPAGQVASSEPAKLPRTASRYPLIGLFGVLALGLGSSVWLLPRRQS